MDNLRRPPSSAIRGDYVLTAEERFELESLEEEKRASEEKTSPSTTTESAYFREIDQQGASYLTRAIVGATREEDQEGTLRGLGFVDIEKLPDGNFIYVDPANGKKIIYNPVGMDLGDVAEHTRTGAQIVGSGVGALAGSLGGPAVAALGAGAGNALAGQAFDVAARTAGQVDTRTGTEMATGAGVEFGVGAAGQKFAPLIASGISKAVTTGAQALRKSGAAGLKSAQEAVQDFGILGSDVVPTLGQAGNRVSQIIEAISQRSIGGVRAFRRHSDRLVDKFDQAVKKRVGALGGVSEQRAGSVAKRGIESHVDRFKAHGGKLFDRVSDFVPDNFPVRLNKLRGILDDMVEFDATSPRLTGRFVNKAIKGIRDDLAEDAAQNGGTVSFSALKLIRSRVGAKLANPSLVDDVGRAEWKRLYGAITGDMKATIEAHGRPGAMKAFDSANKFWKEGIRNIDDILDPLVSGKFPEKIFSALDASGRAGSSMLKEVRRSVTKKEWQILVGTALHKLGRSTAGNQNAMGDAFSVKTFLTNWAKLPKESKAILFNNIGIPGLRKELNTLARVAERIVKSQTLFGNPPESGRMMAAITQLNTGVTAIIAGQPAIAAATLAILPAMNRGAAAFLTNPQLVRWLASGAKVSPKGLGSHFGRLISIGSAGDIETREAVREYLELYAASVGQAVTAAVTPPSGDIETREAVVGQAVTAAVTPPSAAADQSPSPRRIRVPSFQRRRGPQLTK